MRSKKILGGNNQRPGRRGIFNLWIIGVVVVIGVIAVVAYGVLNVGKFKKGAGDFPSQVVEDQQIKDLKNFGTSDELDDIERDVNATNLENLDQELPQVEGSVGDL